MEQDTAGSHQLVIQLPLRWTWESLAQLAPAEIILLEHSITFQLARLIRKRDNVTLKAQMEITAELVQLVDSNPRLALEQDSQGWLPVHVAIENDLPLECIKILLEPCPADEVVKHRFKEEPSGGRFESMISSAKTEQVCEFLTERAIIYLRSTIQEYGWECIQSFFVFHSSIEYVVRRLVQEFPAFLRKKWHFYRSRRYSDSERMLPLHCAVLQQVPIEILHVLVSGYPKALNVTMRWRKHTPLHVAIDSGYVDPNVLQLLSTSKSLQIYSSQGKLPLHVYLDCHDTPDLQVVQSMVELYPKSVKMSTKGGSTPLHLACNRSFATIRNLDLIQYLIEKYPSALAMTDSCGCTPLLGVCHAFHDPGVLSLVRLLVEASPESVRQLDPAGNTVLHRYLLGLSSPSSLDIVEYLTSAYPGSLLVRDKVKNMTPLDVACVQVRVDVIRYLTTRYPEMVESISTMGFGSPLHRVCSEYLTYFRPPTMEDAATPFDAMMSALSVSEEVVLAKDSEGQTPLHILCKRPGPPLEFLQVLVEKFPSMAGAKDNIGRIPLHTAVQNCSECSRGEEYDDIISCLLDSYPLGVHVVDDRGMTPLMLACEENACLNTIFKLVKIDPIASRGFEWSQVPRQPPPTRTSFLSVIANLLMRK